MCKIVIEQIVEKINLATAFSILAISIRDAQNHELLNLGEKIR